MRTMNTPDHLRVPEGQVCAQAYIRNALRYTDGGEALAQAAGHAVSRPEQAQGPSRLEQKCGACAGAVILEGGDVITAENCKVSGSCEKSWIDMYPEQYIGSDGQPDTKKLPCGGTDCDAVFKLRCVNGELQAEQANRETLLEALFISKDRTFGPDEVDYTQCKIDREGAIFQQKGRFLLDNMPLTDTAGSAAIEDDSLPVTRVPGLPDDQPAYRTAEPPTTEGWQAL